MTELRDGRWLVITGIEAGGDGKILGIHLAEPQSSGSLRNLKVSLKDFVSASTGAILYFEKINTALVCFSIIAGEHKIEITRDRLLHEYNLSLDEIPTVKLLRIAKDLGLKARLLNLQWDGLLNLKKAYPAIAKLRNGRHMILVGITHGHGDLQQETMIACYDPLAGSGGAHLRLTREEFEAVWSGEIYLFKRTYKLSDETQPFSLDRKSVV